MTNSRRIKPGRLVVRYGPMGAGKTSWLIDQFIPQVTLAFVPLLDHRSGGSLKTHNGKKLINDRIMRVEQDRPELMLSKITGFKRILIDETNFFAMSLIEVVERIRALGIEVMASGALLDSDLEDFGPTRKLAINATQAKALLSHCDYRDIKTCQNPAIFNYFKGKKSGQVVVGAFDLYGSACMGHFGQFRRQYGGSRLAENINLETVWQVVK